jgi:surface antigen
MTDKYGEVLGVGDEVVFVTNSNSSPYIEVGKVTNIYGDACTIQNNGKSHPHIYSHRIICRNNLDEAFRTLPL